MKAIELSNGDAVKVVSGIYKGAEGTVADLQAECSVVRITTEEGDNVYALLETAEKTG